MSYKKSVLGRYILWTFSWHFLADCCIHHVYLVAPFSGSFQYNCFLSIKKRKKSMTSYHFSIHFTSTVGINFLSFFIGAVKQMKFTKYSVLWAVQLGIHGPRDLNLLMLSITNSSCVLYMHFCIYHACVQVDVKFSFGLPEIFFVGMMRKAYFLKTLKMYKWLRPWWWGINVWVKFSFGLTEICFVGMMRKAHFFKKT